MSLNTWGSFRPQRPPCNRLVPNMWKVQSLSFSSSKLEDIKRFKIINSAMLLPLTLSKDGWNFWFWKGGKSRSAYNCILNMEMSTKFISLQVNNKYVHFVQSGLITIKKLWHTAVALQTLITSASKHTAKYGIFRFQTDRKLEMTLSVKPVYQLHNEPFLKEKKNGWQQERVHHWTIIKWIKCPHWFNV